MKQNTMNTIRPESNIPPQHEGHQVDFKVERHFSSNNDAQQFYKIASSRLLNVYDWKDCSDLPVAKFVIIDSEHREVIRPVSEGDVLRIDIPGPGSVSGDGYDWVRVESLKEVKDSDGSCSNSMLLRPTSNPLSEENEVSHFFNETSSSTLIVSCINEVVYAEYHGRNEVINFDTEHIVDKIRNTMVGVGAKLGLSKIEWKCLIEALLE